MKKFLIGTTALITAGMLVSSVANAQVTNAAKDTINFELSGSIKSTIAFGTNSELSEQKKNLPDSEKGLKNSIRNFDIWNEGDLEGTASYTASDELAKVKSVKAHITLVDGAIVGKKDLSMFVETDTAFGNIILGDKNFTSVMGVKGDYDDDEGSDYKYDINGDNIMQLALSNDDLADDIEARIQYNTGDLIKLSNGGIVIGASVALNPENTDYASTVAKNADIINEGIWEATGNDPDDYESVLQGTSSTDPNNDQGFTYLQGNIANLVISGGVSYNGTFGDTKVSAVGSFQHTNGVNVFNVSGGVGMSGDMLHINGGFSMLMTGDYTLANGEKLKKSDYAKDLGPLMSFYASGDYTVNALTFGAGAHFGFQSYGDTANEKGTGTIKGHKMEIGVAAEANLKLAENVNWTMAKVNFDMHQDNGKSNAAKKFGGAKTAFGLQSVVKVSF